jgi:hypothetical protein
MKRNWHDLVEFLLGSWIILAPFVLGFFSEGGPAGTAILIGSLVVGLMIIGISVPSYWEEWTSLALGLALLVSPWVIGYSAMMVATANAVISGALLAGLAVIGLIRERGVHHHPEIGAHR